MRFEIKDELRITLFENKSGQVLKKLSEISSIMITNQSLEIDKSLIKESLYSSNEDISEFLITNENNISFKKKEYLAISYAEYICQDLILGENQETDGLINVIKEEDWKLGQLINEYLLIEEVLICLSRKHQYNVILYLNEIISTRKDFWNVYHSLCKALMTISFDVDDLIKFLVDTNDFRKGDMMSGYIVSTLVYLATNNEEIGTEIYTKFMESEDLAGLLPNVIVERSKKNFEKIYNELIDLVKSEELSKISLAINTLGRLDYSDKESYLRKTIETIKELIQRGDDLIDAASCSSIYHLIEYDQKESGELLLMVNHNAPEVQNEISWILNSRKEAIYDKEWCKNLLFSIINIDVKHRSIISNVDQFLGFLISKDEQGVEEFLNQWILKNEGDSLDISSIFSSCTLSLKNNKEFLQVIITKWLNSDNYKHHKAVGYITSSFFESEEKGTKVSLELDVALLQDFNFRDIKYILFKILGYVFDNNQKCSLVFSLLKNKGVPEAKDLVHNAFYEIILYDYPVRKDFLKAKMKVGDKLEKEVAKKAIESFEKYEDELNNLEKLNELKPSRHKLRSQQLMDRKQQNLIRDEARKSSFLLEVVKNINIKYGKGWTYYQDSKIAPPSYMGSFSTTIPVPRTIFMNPIDSEFQSIQWRMARREDVI